MTDKQAKELTQRRAIAKRERAGNRECIVCGDLVASHTETLDCCICGLLITEHEGNNAEPVVKDGQSCAKCDEYVTQAGVNPAFCESLIAALKSGERFEHVRRPKRL